MKKNFLIVLLFLLFASHSNYAQELTVIQKKAISELKIGLEFASKDNKAVIVGLIMRRNGIGFADALLNIEKVADDPISRKYVLMAINDFSEGINDRIYINLKGLGLSQENARSLTEYMITSLKAKENTFANAEEQRESIEKKYSMAIDYAGFVKLSEKVLWTVRDGISSKNEINEIYIEKSSSSVKAIFGYYSMISNAFTFHNLLKIGDMCSTQHLGYVKNFFKNNQEFVTVKDYCEARAFSGQYFLDRLETSIEGKIVNVSFAMTFYDNGRSVDQIVGEDKFAINADGTITIVQLSSKLSPSHK